MNTDEKTYDYMGEKITRKWHPVDAYQHYEYTTLGKKFTSLADAKQYIKFGSFAFEPDELCFIRDEFACIMEQTNNANNELDIINKCCRLLGSPVYDSFDDFMNKSQSGSWEEKQ